MPPGRLGGLRFAVRHGPIRRQRRAARHQGDAFMTTMPRSAFTASAAALASSSAIPVLAQDKPVIKVSSLTKPKNNPQNKNKKKARVFDAKHGFTLYIHA